ncbi:MAG: YqcI/YcgG family protein [Euryarchaeota archaeon]|nr:YqcI/YcgG family protein [Euryarchaeota archaeon]
MAKRTLTRLFKQETVQERIEKEELPNWAQAHYRTFQKSMFAEFYGESPFPCYFGVDSEQKGWPLYTFCMSMNNEDVLLNLRNVLLEYLEVFEEYSERASLVVFFKPPKRELAEKEYNEIFWDILQFLHEHDPDPWPVQIPTEPDTPEWEFCFGGEPIFPTCRAPFYKKRKSRLNPHGLEITVKPRRIFRGITADTEAGRRARRVIRERLKEYDEVPPHPDLGNWGEKEDREWKQYMLPESQTERHTNCPFEFSQSSTEATHSNNQTTETEKS